MTQNLKPRLQVLYEEEMKKDLFKQFGYKNIMETPRLKTIVVNSCVKEAALNQSAIDGALQELFLITGQQPLVTKAKKSIASFKIREGMSLGCKVTLRRKIMYEFLDRLVNIALPRVKDFRGFSPRQFDGRGNFSIGLKEQLVFPEINYDRVEKIRGMNITFITSARTNEEAKALFEMFKLPFIQ